MWLRAPDSYFKYSQAFKIAHVFLNMHSGGRQSGRHFSSQTHIHEAWCVLFLIEVKTKPDVKGIKQDGLTISIGYITTRTRIYPEQ
mgnify:CR=1 FL=1